LHVEEELKKSPDTKSQIQKYLDQAFNTEIHPLGILMQRLEIVYKASYGGMGANKYLLPHAIAETHSLIQRIHGIVRILFPMLSGGDKNVSQTGLMKVEGYSDPDDYVDIESGYGLLHSLVFTRLFPTLITLYVLHHEESDTGYQRGLDFLRDMDDERVATYIKFPEHLCKKVAGEDTDIDILKAIDQASSCLRVISSLFTPGEFLTSFRDAFTKLSSIEQLTGDFLLPAVVLILVKANVPHLGAYLHFLTDFAHTEPADEYTLVTYEVSNNAMAMAG
jgi:amyotrophic lateral sclerosis 2 protein